MEYTPEIISKLGELLDKIRAEELRAQKLCQKLDKQLKELVNNNEIKDYTMHYTISIDSVSNHISWKFSTERGFPYCEEEYFFFIWDDEEFMNKNWSNLGWGNSPLKDLHFCFSAAWLFFHSGLSLKDFLEMDRFKFDVNVVYQFVARNEHENIKSQKDKENRVYRTPNFLFFETETAGLPADLNRSPADTKNWPRLLKLSWIYKGDNIDKEIVTGDYLIKPEGFSIPELSTEIHGITTAMAEEKGNDLKEVLDKFRKVLRKADFIVGSHIGFHAKVVAAEFIRNGMKDEVSGKEMIDTLMKKSISYEFMNFKYEQKSKPIRPSEMNEILFDESETKVSSLTDLEWKVKQFYKMRELIEKSWEV